MAEDFGEPATWKELWARERELKTPIDVDYERNVGPLRRRKDVAIADVEREYGETLRIAKARFAAQQRDFRQTTFDLKRWRDAKVKALTHEYQAEQRVWSQQRKERMAPIIAWKNRQWTRLHQAVVQE